jgi:hypothetical protein
MESVTENFLQCRFITEHLPRAPIQAKRTAITNTQTGHFFTTRDTGNVLHINGEKRCVVRSGEKKYLGNNASTCPKRLVRDEKTKKTRKKPAASHYFSPQNAT